VKSLPKIERDIRGRVSQSLQVDRVSHFAVISVPYNQRYASAVLLILSASSDLTKTPDNFLMNTINPRGMQALSRILSNSTRAQRDLDPVLVFSAQRAYFYTVDLNMYHAVYAEMVPRELQQRTEWRLVWYLDTDILTNERGLIDSHLA